MYLNRQLLVNKMKNEESIEVFIDQIRRRFAKSFLDLLILQLVEDEPTWGYDIIKKTEKAYKVKLRHGALYPMLNKLETKGLLKSRRELQKGRVRKIYDIATDGRQRLHAYHDFLREQIPEKTVNKSRETKE